MYHEKKLLLNCDDCAQSKAKSFSFARPNFIPESLTKICDLRRAERH